MMTLNIAGCSSRMELGNGDVVAICDVNALIDVNRICGKIEF